MFRLYPGLNAQGAQSPLPLVSSINYAGGQTRANNAVLALSEEGYLAVYWGQPTGTTHLILDVTGYFE